jgi:hypothetical protein
MQDGSRPAVMSDEIDLPDALTRTDQGELVEVRADR